MVKAMQTSRVGIWGRLVFLVAALTQPNFAQAQTSQDLLGRVVVIGASFSSGAGHMHELGAHASLPPFVQSVFTPDSFGPQALAPLDRGNYLTFINPVLLGGLQIQAALEHKASLVIGLDFLFWYAHGFLSEGERIRRLEIGLAELDRLPCPILVGDLPDIAFAMDGVSRLTNGPLIWPGMLPSAEERSALNQRIRDWVAERPRVTLAPLASFVSKVHGGETLELRGTPITSKGFEELIQSDLLHPTADGSLALLIIAADALVQARPELDAGDILVDLDAAHQALLARIEPLRAQAEARRKRIDRLTGNSR